jgi:hypothetical protein
MSGGPSTEEGKAIVARNAVRHGVLSPNPVVGEMETAEAWQAHQLDVLAALDPQGGMERALAERVALNLWRLGRVVRYETERVTRRQESVEADWTFNKGSRGHYGPEGQRGPQAVAEEPGRWERLTALFRSLPEMRPEQTLTGLDAEAFFEVLAALVQASDVDFLRIPGLAPGYLPRSRPVWEVETFRDCWNKIAHRHRKDPEALAQVALQEFERRRLQAEARAELVRRELAALRRERLVPHVDDLEKVTRYEAHLSRELYRALHELEAMQARRRGHLATVLRVDVNGGPPG